MVKDVIEGIKATEAEAAAMIEDARKMRGAIVAGAREEARRAEEEAFKHGREEVKVALDGARKDAEARVESIAQDEKQARETVRRFAAGNISKAVEVVIERMLR